MHDDLNHPNQPDDAESRPAFLAKVPATVSNPFIFAAPHSGRYYPKRFHALSTLDKHQLRLSEDAFVDDLFDGVTLSGATQLVATHARSFLDLNRAANELEPGMFSGEVGDHEIDLNNRVKAGLGVVPRIIGEGMPIYGGLIPIREAFKRLDEIYAPYHNTLKDLMLARHKQFDSAVLIDCHSMPSGPELGRRSQAQPDIVLGDCHALQIEINRSLYMNEKTVEKLEHFDEVGQRIQDVCRSMIGSYDQLPNSLAKKAAE